MRNLAKRAIDRSTISTDFDTTRVRRRNRASQWRTQPVADAAVDLLQAPGFLLTHEMAPNRQGLIIADVRIRTVKACLPARQTCQQLVQSRLIAIATLPID